MSEIYIDDKILNSLVAVMLVGPFVFVLNAAQQAQTSHPRLFHPEEFSNSKLRNILRKS